MRVEREAVKSAYHRVASKRIMLTIAFILVAAIALLLTLGFGTYDISLIDSLKIFFDHIAGNITNKRADLYIWNVRLPRAIAALTMGAGLAVAGAIMQNDFRNPLAEPYTMGISSGAFLGATLSIILEVSLIPGLHGDNAIIANAFIFSLAPTAIIILVSTLRRISPTGMILIGIAIMFLFTSVSRILMVIASPNNLSKAYTWLVGSMDKVTWDSVPLMIIPTVIGIALLYSIHKKLDIMYLGDVGAKTLGVDAKKLRIISLIIVSLMTASLVCFTGPIGFIGLVGPHIARIFTGSKNKYLLPASAAFGAAFLILADTVAKVTGTSGLPVGVVCSMIGGPLFLWILVQQKKGYWA